MPPVLPAPNKADPSLALTLRPEAFSADAKSIYYDLRDDEVTVTTDEWVGYSDGDGEYVSRDVQYPHYHQDGNGRYRVKLAHLNDVGIIELTKYYQQHDGVKIFFKNDYYDFFTHIQQLKQSGKDEKVGFIVAMLPTE